MTALPDRDTVAGKLASFAEPDRSYIELLMQNPVQDDHLLEGLNRHLDLSSAGRFLNSLKLEKLGEWLGQTAPGRLQIRLMEVARSGQHAAYQAFRTGLTRSGGLQRAYPEV